MSNRSRNWAFRRTAGRHRGRSAEDQRYEHEWPYWKGPPPSQSFCPVSVSVNPTALNTRNFSAVAPSTITAPSASGVGPSMACPFSIVPFLPPRSSRVALVANGNPRMLPGDADVIDEDGCFLRPSEHVLAVGQRDFALAKDDAMRAGGFADPLGRLGARSTSPQNTCPKP